MASGTDFPGSNAVLGAPKGVENVIPLSVFRNGVCCVSCWQLSDEELVEIIKTRRVYLSVFWGDTQPPVFLGSETAVRDMIADYGGLEKMTPQDLIEMRDVVAQLREGGENNKNRAEILERLIAGAGPTMPKAHLEDIQEAKVPRGRLTPELIERMIWMANRRSRAKSRSVKNHFTDNTREIEKELFGMIRPHLRKILTLAGEGLAKRKRKRQAR
jgi:hypothetical protein